jgi:hypothetical protein
MSVEVRGVLAGAVMSIVLTLSAAAQQPSAPPAIADVPVIGFMLDHRDELGLSAEQVSALERLGLDFVRETVRREADLTLTGIDLDGLLPQDPEKIVDIGSAEAKLRELERIRADLDVALLHVIAAGRAELTPAQRAKFVVLTMQALGQPMGAAVTADGSAPADPPDPPSPGGARPPAPRVSGPPPPGRVPPRGPGGHPPLPQHHPTIRGGFVFGFWGPLWWGGPSWSDHPAPPVIVAPPPAYTAAPPTPAYWYYCSSASAYYPYVSTCPEAWLVVPSTLP